MRVEKPTKTVHFPTVEREALEKWDGERTFQCSVNERSKERRYAFFDGPPFATGLPHYGHIVASIIKDAFPRYFTMKGFRVERRFGWDCHGLPVELLIQNELGLKGRSDVEALGVGKFNEACRASVLRYTSEWREYIRRIGRWVDMDNEYRTMDRNYMESVWAVFKKLWDKGLVYQGKFIMSYSCPLGATLSNFEAGQDYRDIQDPSITIKARLKGRHAGRSLLVWTTTPWTLPANVAVVVDPESLYAEVECAASGERYYVLKERVGDYWKPGTFTNHGEIVGNDLVGESYEPFFPYYVETAGPNAFKVYPADYILHDTGTGAVHTAPAFGEDDFKTARRFDLPLIDNLDMNGRFVPQNHPETVGLEFKAGDKILIADLKTRGLVFKHDTLVHSYPFCYRSGTPLIYRAMPSWFVSVEKIKGELLASNRQIHWVPEHLQEGRFGKWLENARDWNIARERYWGNPIPIWHNAETGETLCIGSVAELEQYAGRSIDDLHMHFIDDIAIPSPTGKGVLRRVPYVFDCWFESGAMPYAQMHYPFEKASEFEESFPADFICEGLDQTRGWFYTLTVLSTALFGKPAFKNVVVNGMILAEDGRKMSKSLRNYPDPMYVLNEYGADAIRLYLFNSPAVVGDEVRFSEEGVKESIRKILLPLWNAYSFFATYASIDSFDPEREFVESSNELDRWALLRVNELLRQINSSMSNYHIDEICPAVTSFLDDLNNWYIRRSRRRFWNSDREAYSTLWTILVSVSQCLAPVAPFAAEYFFGKLALTKELQTARSVHLTQLPDARELTVDEENLLAKFDIARRVVELGRTIRVAHKIKNRQPLQTFTVGVVSDRAKRFVEETTDVIREELNVKRVEVTTNSEHLARIVIKPNLKILGRQLGEKLKTLQQLLPGVSREVAQQAQQRKTIQVGEFSLTPEMVIVELVASGNQLVAVDADIVAALDPTISEELRMEGIARELVSHVQKARKAADFDVDDRIALAIKSSAALEKAVFENRQYIEDETLSTLQVSVDGDAFGVEVKVEGEDVRLSLKRLS
jgi:isoleucyl-tRNA synthetase